MQARKGNSPKGKNIVLCFDGTGNRYGRHKTNVVRLYEMLVRDETQVAFYDPGVGTTMALGRHFFNKAGKLSGKAFGSGIQRNIEEGYRYLMRFYEKDDRVFLFGFSRGAYTARALTWMLQICGLLEAGKENLIPSVRDIYNRVAAREETGEVAAGFRRAFSRECVPYFVGVWDTVASLWFNALCFEDLVLNPEIPYGYHAIAIDEKREKFPVNLWEPSREPGRQTIQQVWFAGVHSDIGGGYDDRSLSDITLEWMARKAKEDIKLLPGWDKQLNGNPCGPMHRSWQGGWCLWPPAVRKIPEGALVHESVITRQNDTSVYHPNLPKQYEVVS